jgi:hypothetical protein
MFERKKTKSYKCFLNFFLLYSIRKSISRRYAGIFNLQDRIRSTFSSCGSLVFSGSEDGQVNCWHTYNGNLIYSFKSLHYTQPVLDIQFHPFDNLLAMCSIGPLHQVYVFQHTFNDADIEAKPISHGSIARGASTPIVTSDVEQRTPLPASSRHDDSGRYTTVSDTDRSIRKGRTESSGDELPRTDTGRHHDRRNRRLAVVNKILDEMDDAIVSKDFCYFSINILFYLESKIWWKTSSRFYHWIWWWSYDVPFN